MLHKYVKGNHCCLPHPAVAEDENQSDLTELTEEVECTKLKLLYAIDKLMHCYYRSHVLCVCVYILLNKSEFGL